MPHGRFIASDQAIRTPRVIFVEGLDDQYFFDSLLEELHAQPSSVSVVAVGGGGEFPDRLVGFLKSGELRRRVEGFLVALDADNNAAAAKRRIHKVLRGQRQPTPDNLQYLPGNPGVGLVIIPPRAAMGNLDSMLLDTVAREPRHFLATKFLEDVQTQYGPLDGIPKRAAQAYISACPGELCRGSGYGYKQGLFDRASPAVADVRNVVHALIL